MYNYKRVTLLCGHYGSGKTNVAVNMAFDLAKKGKKPPSPTLTLSIPISAPKTASRTLKKPA